MKIFALTYSENTDCGDPTNSMSCNLYLDLADAQKVMEDAYQKVDAIMHYSEMEQDDEHEVSKTETSIYVRNGIDSLRWSIEGLEVHGTEVLEEPLTPSETLQMQKETGYTVDGKVISWKASDDLDKINDSSTGEQDFPDFGPDAVHPTKLVEQRCEECGKAFLLRYKAKIDSSTGVYIDDGYDYVGDTCDCKSYFAPDDGEESIAEWVERPATTTCSLAHLCRS